MRLTELEPQFFRYDIRVEKYRVVDGEWVTDKNDYILNCGRWWKDLNDEERGTIGTREIEGPREYHVNVDTLAEAQGIRFLCPICFTNKENGVHSVLMPFAERGHTAPHMWNVSGSGYHDLSTTPSYLIVGGCNWHGYITNGEVSIL
jgi:hypothetical protein